eukprot:356781-Chlamydomonas_euryale.AAC.14
MRRLRGGRGRRRVPHDEARPFPCKATSVKGRSLFRPLPGRTCSSSILAWACHCSKVRWSTSSGTRRRPLPLPRPSPLPEPPDATSSAGMAAHDAAAAGASAIRSTMLLMRRNSSSGYSMPSIATSAALLPPPPPPRWPSRAMSCGRRPPVSRSARGSENRGAPRCGVCDFARAPPPPPPLSLRLRSRAARACHLSTTAATAGDRDAAAACSAVPPGSRSQSESPQASRHAALVVAPLASSAAHTSAWPASAAYMSGVWPPHDATSTSCCSVDTTGSDADLRATRRRPSVLNALFVDPL